MTPIVILSTACATLAATTAALAWAWLGERWKRHDADGAAEHCHEQYAKAMASVREGLAREQTANKWAALGWSEVERLRAKWEPFEASRAAAKLRARDPVTKQWVTEEKVAA